MNRFIHTENSDETDRKTIHGGHGRYWLKERETKIPYRYLHYANSTRTHYELHQVTKRMWQERDKCTASRGSTWGTMEKTEVECWQWKYTEFLAMNDLVNDWILAFSIGNNVSRLEIEFSQKLQKMRHGFKELFKNRQWTALKI